MSPLKNNYLTLKSKVIMVRDTPSYGHAPTYHIPHIIDLSGKTKKLWSGQASLRRSGRLEVEAVEVEKIRLKQYVSLRSKGRHNS